MCKSNIFVNTAGRIDQPVESMDDGFMSIADFIIVLFTMRDNNLLLQVLGQCSRLLDEDLPLKWKSNPMDIEYDTDPLPKGARRDVAFSDKLCLGEGGGESKKRVHDTSQHIISWSMFQLEHKRIKLDPTVLNTAMCLRLTQVGEAVFSHVQHLSVASDGIRISCKDVNYFLFGGKFNDRYRTSWSLMAPYISYTQS